MSERVLGGRYTVQDKIGTGGMAIVYRGLDEVLGRTVAIKTMLPQYAGDASFAARFKQEAQAAAALQSPYIVSVYDWGKDGDTYYIVMEYLRGTDLKSGIRKHGALDCRKVAQIGSQIAQALNVAHRHDIIHRDIKPQNIMVQPDGNVKVMDFGIARAKNSHLTQDNSVLGTAHYVSPEQTQGKNLGPTTDIYSLGVVMYEAATGKVPFDGDDAISVALKQVNEQPKPPSQRNPKIDAALEGIILKCMQKNPAERFQTADELYHVLRDYLSGRINAVSSATARIAPMAPLGGGTATTPLTGDAASGTATMPQVRPNNTGRIKPQTATEMARHEAEERERKTKLRRNIGIVLAILVIATLGIAAYNIFGRANEQKPAPNLVTLTQESALRQIADSNWFTRGSVTESYDEKSTSGTVIDQTPDAGVMSTKGTRIDIVVSKGPKPAETVQVPDLTNMTPSEAAAALAKVNLSGQAGDSVFSSDVENGKVAEQSPAAGASAKAGDKVTYKLSKGTERVSVPDVTGMSESNASAEIKNAGLGVNVAYENSDDVEKGLVIRQSLTGSAEKGATVTITVSNGTSKVSIPNVVGKTQDEAESLLDNAGLRYNTREKADSSVAAGRVISQSKTGTAEKGTTVTIYVSTGPASTPGGTGTNTGGGTGTNTGGGTGGNTGGGTGGNTGGNTGDNTGGGTSNS